MTAYEKQINGTLVGSRFLLVGMSLFLVVGFGFGLYTLTIAAYSFFRSGIWDTPSLLSVTSSISQNVRDWEANPQNWIAIRDLLRNVPFWVASIFLGIYLGVYPFFWKNKYSRKLLGKLTLFQALDLHTQQFFSAQPHLKTIDKEHRLSNGKVLKRMATEILNSKNPFLAFRSKFAEAVVSSAHWTALCLTKDLKVQVDWSENPYISGELSQYIRSIAEQDDELSEIIEKNEGTDEELLDYCNARRYFVSFHLQGLEIVRVFLDDYLRENDWSSRFFQAMLVWQENTIRQSINLPLLLDNPIFPLAYSAFMNLVINGEADPLQAWRELTKNDKVPLFPVADSKPENA